MVSHSHSSLCCTGTVCVCVWGGAGVPVHNGLAPLPFKEKKAHNVNHHPLWSLSFFFVLHRDALTGGGGGDGVHVRTGGLAPLPFKEKKAHKHHPL